MQTPSLQETFETKSEAGHGSLSILRQIAVAWCNYRDRAGSSRSVELGTCSDCICCSRSSCSTALPCIIVALRIITAVVAVSGEGSVLLPCHEPFCTRAYEWQDNDKRKTLHTMLLACRLSTATPLPSASRPNPLAAAAAAAAHFLSFSTARFKLSLSDSATAPLPPQPGLGACTPATAPD